MSTSDSEYKEYQESTTITFEWTVKGLKQLFDSSKGETKSKVTKSCKFGGGRWQILLYPNSGHEGGYVSLYLSCEPTQEEKENAVNGKWLREGLFKFSFDLKSVNKTTPLVFNTKEACDHAFSWKTMNWGWAQFAKRDSVYYSATQQVRNVDAFLIVCTITSSPVLPTPPSVTPRQFVPRGLLDAVGSMLNDPIYSDVEFILPSRGKRASRRIYASKKLLCRAEYFERMFHGGFAEAAIDNDKMGLFMSNDRAAHDAMDTSDSFAPLDDSDESDAENLDDDNAALSSASPTTPTGSVMGEKDRRRENARRDTDTESDTGVVINTQDEEMTADDGEANRDSNQGISQGESSTYVNISTPSAQPEGLPMMQTLADAPMVLGPAKTRVVVRDVAYTTYLAFLYYLYTDSIIFAPLSSNFLASGTIKVALPPLPFVSAPVTPAASLGGSQPSYFSSAPLGGASGTNPLHALLPSRPKSALGAGNPQPNEDGIPRTRKEWVADWEMANPGRPGPVSAKAIYRLADKLNLVDLKDRAFQHIVKSLTVQNIPYEVFSSFSAAFEEVRKVQTDYFLHHWAEIRGGEAMKNVFQQIRLGRHPGFEDIWPMIVVNLEFKPRVADVTGPNGASMTDIRMPVGEA